MKKTIILFCILSAISSFAEISISNVEVFSGYPWKEVVIGYEITGSTDKQIMFDVTAKDNISGKTYVCKTLYGVDFSPGSHVIKWDALTDGAKFKSSDVGFTIKIKPTPPLYYVVDLSGGLSATSYPITALSNIPKGGWTDEYKTTKLVLRRIESGSFMMQNKYEVTLTHPFYIGVFEVTQRQWSLVMGSWPSFHGGEAHPVEFVTYDMIRGDAIGAGWPVGNRVDATSFLGRLRAKTRKHFDLPTEAQWEYACRAGTTSDYNNGGVASDDFNKRNDALDQVGRYWNNGGSDSYHAKVGSYFPNAWGLYDMHGNVAERCLDWKSDIGPATDPMGPTRGLYRVIRGGDFGSMSGGCTSSYRTGMRPGETSWCEGFRLSLTLQE